MLIIDCGVLFPEDHQPGVDLILPDFSYIADRLNDVVAVVLTHGHEDHIGAVPYLLRLKPDLPLVGSQLTLALVEAKLREHRIVPRTLAVKEGQHEQFGPFGCQFIAVNHSIPDALAVAVRTSAGTVLHTGDFKMDQLPLDGRITDLRALAKLGEEGVDLFMVDSTNAEVPGFTVSEREITPVLNSVFAAAERRVIVASFASHVHRVQQVLDAAHAHGRRVALVGRSMVRNMGIAKDLGYLNVPANVLIDLKSPATAGRAGGADVHRVAGRADGGAVADGQPGPPGGDRPRRHRGPGLLADPGQRELGLPGDQRPDPARRQGGAPGNARVHVSGHASAGELLYCYNIVKPKNVMPVHGESRHLVANAELAVLTGVPRERVVIAEDGFVIDLVGGVAKIAGRCPAGTSTSTAPASGR